MRSARTDDEYLLGHDDVELDRLEQQAAILAPATTALLTMAGIAPGMRVLDLGTGAGDVAMLAAELVGSSGAVLGVDRALDALETARTRAAGRGFGNVTFVEGDVRDFQHEDFDAVIGRLVLLYTPEPSVVIRHHAAALRPGSVVLAMEYDMAAARVLPACPTAGTAIRWVNETFSRAGLDPALGPKLASVLAGAGLDQAATLGIQPYLDPGLGARMLSGIIRTLLPVIEQTGVATTEEIDAATLEGRLEREMRAENAVMAPPTLVGAWARVT